MSRRLALRLVAVLGAALLAFALYRALKFPPNDTPEGAYQRVAANLGAGDHRTPFSYLEDAAQHACFTIRDYRKRARERVDQSYPEPERARLLEAYEAHANAGDGADVWVEMAERLGWIARLRRDLSGIARVDRQGDRATIETARGTRYGFRRRDNGMWGMTLFTAELTAEAERAARDFEVVDRAATDYERVR